jgi:putative aminopeptidase FrvX
VKLGGGPSLTHGTANHPLVVKRLIETAADIQNPVQHEASSRFTGTDTDKIFHSRQGMPSALVSLPLRCMHSVVETAHLDDIAHTIGLLTDLRALPQGQGSLPANTLSRVPNDFSRPSAPRSLTFPPPCSRPES